MKNVKNDSIFNPKNIDMNTLHKLGVFAPGIVLTPIKQNIINIFKKAGEQGKENGLTITQITIAYYNEYTKPSNEDLKDKNNITVILHRMTQQGILESHSRGTYKMREVFYKEKPVFDRSTNKWVSESENIKNAQKKHS
ncbi:MAG: hypothetical protein MJ170_03940 [Alphaproteobacteria bacterium]|nr:hypothetical protein [Alphaproteobacteria bacterium]